jgi:DNA processing protein
MIESIEFYALQLLEGIGDQSLRKIISKRYSINELLHLPDEDLKKVLPSKITHEFLNNNFYQAFERAESDFERFDRSQIYVVNYNDDYYPPYLRLLEDFPILLYCIGNKALLRKEENIAVIGTRENSEVGQKVAKSTAYYFAEKGFTIVSGLARGIDAVGHIGALEAKGGTIAVLIDVSKIYPKENAILAERIVESGGLLLSENKPGSFQGKNAFVLRDRIQSGLSLGIFPIETDIKGGTMHTVGYAKKQNRLIFVPDVFHPSLQAQYANSVGYSFSKINGIKELINNREAIPYSKENYSILEEKLQIKQSELRKETENRATNKTVELGLPFNSEEQQPMPNEETITPIAESSVLEVSEEKQELELQITENSNSIQKKDDVLSVSDQLSRQDLLIIERTMLFKKEINTLLTTDQEIIRFKSTIQETLEKFIKDFKKLSKSKKTPTTPKKKKTNPTKLFD